MDQSSQPVDKKEALKISVDGASSGGRCEGAREGEDEGSEARRRPRLKSWRGRPVFAEVQDGESVRKKNSRKMKMGQAGS